MFSNQEANIRSQHRWTKNLTFFLIFWLSDPYIKSEILEHSNWKIKQIYVCGILPASESKSKTEKGLFVVFLSIWIPKDNSFD